VKKSDPALSEALLREAGALAEAERTSPVILADCAEAQFAAAAAAAPEDAAVRRANAAQIYRDLLKWHPRAAQKDTALAALARIAVDAGDTETALAYYDRLERDTPWSSLMGEVLTTRAGIEMEAGNTEKALEAYTRLLAAENVPSKMKAQALLALGEIEMSRQRPQTAIPYYQRIYVLYGKWRETVAQAYLRSGEAFEQLKDAEAARKTYEELANSEDLASLPEAETARERLKRFPAAPNPSSS
jgi:tetratricopeptide (TPR) repeat protein